MVISQHSWANTTINIYWSFLRKPIDCILPTWPWHLLTRTIGSEEDCTDLAIEHILVSGPFNSHQFHPWYRQALQATMEVWLERGPCSLLQNNCARFDRLWFGLGRTGGSRRTIAQCLKSGLQAHKTLQRVRNEESTRSGTKHNRFLSKTSNANQVHFLD